MRKFLKKKEKGTCKTPEFSVILHQNKKLMYNNMYRRQNRWLTNGMREIFGDYGYYRSYRRPFDPVAADILALEPDYDFTPYYPYPSYGYGLNSTRRNAHIPANNSNNFFIDTAYITLEDPEWSRMDRMYRSFVRGLWSEDTRPNGTIFKRYNNHGW